MGSVPRGAHIGDVNLMSKSPIAGGDGLVMHEFSVASCLSGGDGNLDVHSIDIVNEAIKALCIRSVRPNQGLALDFQGIRITDFAAALVLARLAFRFRVGEVGEMNNFRNAFYLSFRNLADDQREVFDAALERLGSRPPLIVIAPRTDTAHPEASLLAHHTVGDTSGIERCSPLFGGIWRHQGPIRLRDIVPDGSSTSNGTPEGNRRATYVGLLVERRLVAKLGRGVYAPVN